jgi:hypothetical protein
MKIKNQINQFMVIVWVVVSFACTPMDHYYSDLIPDADKIYPGKADSVMILSGHNRAIVNCLISSDPKVVKLKVYWQNRQDSIETEIASSDIGKRKDIVLDPLAEGTYNFELVTFDAQNNHSVTAETFGRVYGNMYISSLNNRVISSKGFDEANNAFIVWVPENTTDLIGTELHYTDMENNTVSTVIPKDETTTLLPGYKSGAGISYRAMYLPVITAIDTFYSDVAEISFLHLVNVALGKPVTASDILDPNNETQKPVNAVDGKYAITDPRWVSSATGEHWLEIDLETQYTIHSFSTWNGAGGYNNPIPKFKFQAWKENEWVDIVSVEGNADPLYHSDFTPVTTNKVRLYTYSQTRLYEIAVYCNM